MSWKMDADGKVTFTCNGCGKTKTTRSTKTLPRSWAVTGVLASAVPPEDVPDGDRNRFLLEQQKALLEAGELIGAHFHSMKCGKKTLEGRILREKVLKAGVALVLYGKAELVIDGTGGGALAIGRHADAKRPKSPPEFELGDGPSPI